MTKGGGKENSKEVNECEKKRLSTIQANKEFLEYFGIKRAAASLNSLIKTIKEKNRCKGRNTTQEDDDFVSDNEYFADDDHMNKEYENEPEMSISTKTSKTNEGKKKSTFVPPMSLAKFLKKNKKQTEGIMKGDELTSVSKALKIIKEAICSYEQLDDIDGSNKNYVHEKGMQNEESNGNHSNSS